MNWVKHLLDRFMGRLPTGTPGSMDLLPFEAATGKKVQKATIADVLALGEVARTFRNSPAAIPGLSRVAQKPFS
ncbi:MAG: hypothetical protein M5U26_03505 [Planctomycetota bacterium]|nr:hypothetical protein [Planctomycetota bacterium]